jgi:hypothetical protein
MLTPNLQSVAISLYLQAAGWLDEDERWLQAVHLLED